MEQHPEDNPLGLIKDSSVIPIEHVNFSDNQEIAETVSYLTEVARTLNQRSIEEFGGRSGPERLEGLTEQVIGAAFQTFDGEELHPAPFDKATIMLRGITQGHPFPDGNKRTGFLTAIYYLQEVGIFMPNNVPVEEIHNFCMKVSSGEIRDEKIIEKEFKKFFGINEENESTIQTPQQ